jgi:hypothetical protein
MRNIITQRILFLATVLTMILALPFTSWAYRYSTYDGEDEDPPPPEKNIPIGP